MILSNYNSITDVPGIRVGQAQDFDGLTGCTVILCDSQTTGGMDQRGGAPGTRQTDSLSTLRLVTEVHAVLLAGGSAFGLCATDGVVKYLVENNKGLDVGIARIPIVPTAILFDLSIGRSGSFPSPEMAYLACIQASKERPLEGNYGAGCGATVGKIRGIKYAMKSGIGTASIHINPELVIGAIVAVNAFGDVIDPANNQIIAGALLDYYPGKKSTTQSIFADSVSIMQSLSVEGLPRFVRDDNTIIGVVAVNASLTKDQTIKIAQMAHDGLARAIRPSHTMYDGDTIFGLATGGEPIDVNILGTFAAEVVSLAIVNAVKSADTAGGLPAYKDIKND
jgi:L-aminopeptidase/D-esterase-like protein